MSHEATETSNGAQVEKLIHLALPVRLIHTGDGSAAELACTYDIHPRGARLLSVRDVKVGDMLTVERGRLKSVCRVVWTGDRQSALRGQFTVECIEGSRVAWEDELRQTQEQYLPVKFGKSSRPVSKTVGAQNRRRGPRFEVEGEADFSVIGGTAAAPSRLGGRLEQISECGCLITATEPLAPGASLRLILNMCDVSIALRGHVRYAVEDRAMGVEFHEIRQGDQPLLDYVLNRLKQPRSEDFADLEVVTDSMAVAG